MFSHTSKIPSKVLGFTIFRDIFKKPVSTFTSTTKEMLNHTSKIPSKALGFTIFRDIFKKPVSAFTTAAKEEKLDVIRKYNTKELIKFLKEIKELNLERDELNILEKEKFTGAVLLESNREDLRSCGLKYGPAQNIAKFIEEINPTVVERTRRPTGLVHVFVDNSNAFIEARYIVGRLEDYFDHRRNSSYFKSLNIDYGRLLTIVQDGRRLGASPVIVGSRPPPNDSLWNNIRKLGYDVTVHDRNFDNIEKKVVNEISVSMMNTIRYYDPGTMVLVSGDGDFDPTIRQILKDRWAIETWFWTSGISPDLKSKTVYRPLDNLYKSFTYGYGPDTTYKKLVLTITDGDNIRTWWNEEIMECYLALDLFCWYNRLDRNTLCLYFNSWEQLVKARQWMKTNHPDVSAFVEGKNEN